MFRSLSPLLTVDTIEPCLPFWTEHLNFEMVASVPHGDALGFAMLVRDDVRVMYQTRASVADDVPGVLDHLRGGAALFIEVEGLEPIVDAMTRAGAPVVVERRTTFYGKDELFVTAPCGTVVGFAAEATGGSDRPE
jgi:uncharacterized glyoxalase superfamily protein PhnB